ncbi:hypothetical protein J3R83DRAFT_7935 [Lanmaoa asiatica]|nr:hypothetical protein J3R83DRAFT_7935 [Lanmaoa asiatica]
MTSTPHLPSSNPKTISHNSLDRGVRCTLVGLFGEGWCNAKFAALPQKNCDSVVESVGKCTTSKNGFPLLFATINAWTDVTSEVVATVQKTANDFLKKESEVCFEQTEWVEMLEGNGIRFEDEERVGWAMEVFKRGMSEQYVAIVYQVFMSSTLLRPHVTETDATMLSQMSPICAHVEDACVDLM